MKSRSRAALIHFWPSLAMLALIACTILYVWYPYPFLQLKEGEKFALLLVAGAALIGPAMTWLFYKKGKRGLLLDLVVIVLIQLAGMSLGLYALYNNRPYFMVFTVDRFEVFPYREAYFTGTINPKFLDKPVMGPVLLYATMPADEKGFQKLLKEVMFEGKPDLQFRPEFWSPYPEKQQLVANVSKPLSELRQARPESADIVDQLVERAGGDIRQFSFVPVMLPHGNFAAILDADNGEVIGNLDIDPWIN